MSRAKHHSIQTKAFSSYVRKYFDEYHDISDKFKQETKRGGRPSKDTIKSLVNLYNSSNLREKYILALSEQEDKLKRSTHVEASKYLKDVTSKLHDLHKKDVIDSRLSKKIDWLDYTKKYSELKSRNPIRDSAKGGVDEINNRIKQMLSQGRKLNREQLKDNDIGDVFNKIHKEIRSHGKTIYRGGAALGSVGAILTGVLEYNDHLIGNQEFISSEVTTTNTEESIQESSTVSGDQNAGAQEPGTEYGGDGLESGDLIISYQDVFIGLEYAIMVAILVMLVIIVAYAVSNICAQIERERIAKNKTDDALAEKLDSKEKRKEDKYKDRAGFLESIDEITKSR